MQNHPEVVPGLECGVLPRSETILLVEDEAFVRKVAVEVLRSAGYEVLIAQNAAEARRLYDQFFGEVALLLSDVILPDEDGRMLARKLLRENVGLRVLLVTGYGELAATMNSDLSGVECLPKPFSASSLLEKVRRVLDKERWNAGWYPIRHAYDIE